MFNSANPAREKIFSLCHINYINCYIIRINFNPRTESRVDLCGGISRALRFFTTQLYWSVRYTREGCDNERRKFQHNFLSAVEMEGMLNYRRKKNFLWAPKYTQRRFPSFLCSSQTRNKLKNENNIIYRLWSKKLSCSFALKLDFNLFENYCPIKNLSKATLRTEF